VILLTESPEILKLRILLCFQNEDPSICTVTGLSRLLDASKQKISRAFISLEKEGLIDRNDNRRPVLTEKGKSKASYYEERTDIILNHLLYEGLDMDNAEHDAFAWAMFSSDAGFEMLKNSEQRYHAKYTLRKKTRFGGEVLCSHLKDGEYRFLFLIYREHKYSGRSNLHRRRSVLEM
jgi:Mn-dependent DtxR family transcriptional regulator